MNSVAYGTASKFYDRSNRRRLSIENRTTSARPGSARARGLVNGAVGRVLRGTVSSDPQMQEPVRPFRRHRLVRTLKTCRYGEVERELSDDGRFRAASVADDLSACLKTLDIDLHSVTSAVEYYGLTVAGAIGASIESSGRAARSGIMAGGRRSRAPRRTSRPGCRASSPCRRGCPGCRCPGSA